jgi:Uma2 family endonuclease
MLELLQEAGDRAIFSFPSLQRSEAYERVARAYPDHHVEMDSRGNIIVMPPVSLSGGSRESELNFQVQAWNRKTKLGKVFSSQTVFRLPNGAYRMPDTAWLPIQEWNALPQNVKDTYEGVVVPWFAVEVGSPSDDYDEFDKKCREYVAQGVREAWLINPRERTTRIYRPDGSELTGSKQVSGPAFMPGLIVDVEAVWDNL